MTTCSHTPSLDDEVNFKGFGNDEVKEIDNSISVIEDSAITSSACVASPSTSSVPTQLMEDDPRYYIVVHSLGNLNYCECLDWDYWLFPNQQDYINPLLILNKINPKTDQSACQTFH